MLEGGSKAIRAIEVYDLFRERIRVYKELVSIAKSRNAKLLAGADQVGMQGWYSNFSIKRGEIPNVW